MFLSAILSVLGLGVLAYLMFTLAVYALPFFVAVSVGMYLHESEAGVLVALVVAFVAGAITLLTGQIAFATIRSVPVRLAIGALYALPAGVAGFHLVAGLSEVGGARQSWALVFAAIGSAIIGGTAWARIASLAGPEEEAPATHDTFGVSRIANDG